MKRYIYSLIFFASITMMLSSCGGAGGEDPGNEYAFAG